jgi:hypothetical protein
MAFSKMSVPAWRRAIRTGRSRRFRHIPAAPNVCSRVSQSATMLTAARCPQRRRLRSCGLT